LREPDRRPASRWAHPAPTVIPAWRSSLLISSPTSGVAAVPVARCSRAGTATARSSPRSMRSTTRSTPSGGGRVPVARHRLAPRRTRRRCEYGPARPSVNRQPSSSAFRRSCGRGRWIPVSREPRRPAARQHTKAGSSHGDGRRARTFRHRCRVTGRRHRLVPFQMREHGGPIRTAPSLTGADAHCIRIERGLARPVHDRKKHRT
jgi:hypothetical protein